MPPKYYKKKTGYAAFGGRGGGVAKSTKTNMNSIIDFQTALYLLIVESPSKCKKIEEYLGTGYKCIASNGHFREVSGLKSIDTKTTFTPTFSTITSKDSHIKHMRQIISYFDKSNILLATDADREGEAIAWHICDVFDLPIETTKRIVFHEITKTAICNAVANPSIVNMGLVKAQQTRQVLDIIIGYKISPFLWKYIYTDASTKNASTLSAGRCQTPALRIIYDNEKKKSNTMDIKYKTTASFTPKQVVFTLKKEFDNEDQIVDFLEKSKTHLHKVSVNPSTDSIRQPPRPFTTSKLLQTASSLLHISSKQTMECCQELYQAGHITYMRTDSDKYSKTFLKTAESFLLKEYQKQNLIGDFSTITNDNHANPHEAIRVTNLEMRNVTTGDNSRIGSVYKLIWNNTVESCMSAAKYKNHTIQITAPDELQYSYTIEIPVFLGWKTVAAAAANRTNSGILGEKETALLFYFESIKDTTVYYQWIESIVQVHSKNSYYTEGSLIQTLENYGIGRPSTFSSIVDTIIKRGYVTRKNIEGKNMVCKEYKLSQENPVIQSTLKERIFGAEKNKLVIEPTGINTLEFLLNYFEPMFSYDYTKKMEKELDDIDPNKEWSKLARDCYKEITVLSKPITQIFKQVYPIDDTHTLSFTTHGPVIFKKKNKSGEDNAENRIYLPMKKGFSLDIECLKGGAYSIAELVDIEDTCLGTHDGMDIYVKTGKYGNYIEWGDKKISIKNIDMALNTLKMEDIMHLLEPDKVDTEEGEQMVGNTLRELTPTMSIKKGKYGPYVFYKTEAMKKPRFLNIKGFKDGIFICDANVLVEWICGKYKIVG